MSGCFFSEHSVLTTNRKLHMRFRLAPRSMTLDDLELLQVRIFLGISQIWEATTAKRIYSYVSNRIVIFVVWLKLPRGRNGLTIESVLMTMLSVSLMAHGIRDLLEPVSIISLQGKILPYL